MSEPLEPLPDSLRALVDAERACPDPQAEVADKVYGRVAATLGIAVIATTATAATAQASPVAAASARLSLLGHVPYRTLATFLVGATVGAAGYATLSRLHSAAPPPAHVEQAPPAVPLPAPPPFSVPEASPAPAPSSPARVAAAPSARGRDEQLAAERNLVEMARTALARGRADSALLTLHRHARQFPHGQLSEERDSLLIQAWVAKGDVAQARQHAEAFRRRYPSSLFAPAIEQALRSIP